MGEKGIFIIFSIWTIKNLNINEKIILSDIYNKSQLKKFKGYTKKINVLSNELNLKESTIKEIFKKLIREKLITRKPLNKKNSKGQIKTLLVYRYINYKELEKAERFIISKENYFYKKSQKGIFISYEEIRKINNWNMLERYKKSQTLFFILFILIKKKSFMIDNYNFYFLRFSINELSEFLGMTRQTISKYIKSLCIIQNYNSIKSCLLFKIADIENYKEIEFMNNIHISTYDLLDISKSIKENEVIDITSLYLINKELLELLNLDFIKGA